MLAVIACRLLGTCCYFLEGPDCLLLFPHMSWWLLDACWITPQAPCSTTCVTQFSWKSWTNHHLERNGKIWHNFLNSMANFATPNFTCSQLSSPLPPPVGLLPCATKCALQKNKSSTKHVFFHWSSKDEKGTQPSLTTSVGYY